MSLDFWDSSMGAKNNIRIFVDEYSEKFYTSPDEDPDSHPNQGEIYGFDGVKKEYLDKIFKNRPPDMRGVIIISNACDLVKSEGRKRKLDYVALLPIFSIKKNLGLKEFNEEFFQSKDWSYWFKVINQNAERSSYLPPNDLIGDKLGCYIDTQQIKTLNISIFQQYFPTPILCVKSPFKENISNKAANLFQRIPVDTPKKEIIKNWLTDILSQ